MKILLTIFSVFLIEQSLIGQTDQILNDYIINLSGDTIFGDVKKMNSNIKIEFIHDSKSIKYRADKISGYKKGIKVYKTKRINDIPVYVELLFSDIITLYCSRNQLTEYDIDYHLENDNKIISFTENSNWTKYLSLYLKDYQILANAIENKCFNFRDITEIVRLYNNWKKDNIDGINPILSDKKMKGFSQGTITFNNGSTINGFLQFSDFLDVINFISYDGEEATYNLNEVENFKSNGKKYIIIKNKPAKEIIKGKIALYQKSNYTSGINNQSGHSYIRLYILKQESELLTEVDKINLKDFFVDNKFLLQKIDSGYYTIDDLETIIAIYNQL